MQFKLFMITVIVVCIITLSGCSRMQIEETDILTTYFAGVREDNVVLGGGVANVRTFADSMADDPVSPIYAEGKTLAEAQDKLVKSADHPLFFGSVRAVVVSEEFAKRGISEFLESLKSDYKLRSESMFFVTESEPEKIVAHKAINDFSGGFAAESMLENLEAEGRIVCSDISDMFETAYEEKTGIACACVDVSDGIMSFDGYAVFDKDRLIGFTNEKESDGVNAFLNKKSTFDYYIDGAKYTLIKSGERKKARLDNGFLTFELEFDFECKVYNEMTDESFSNVRTALENNVCESLNAAFERVKDEKCDFLNLYRIYQKDFRYEFENCDYGEQLAHSQANIKVNVKKPKRGSVSV